MWAMCEFHESICNGFGDIWWTDNPIYFSSIDIVTATWVHTTNNQHRLRFEVLSVVMLP